MNTSHIDRSNFLRCIDNTSVILRYTREDRDVVMDMLTSTEVSNVQFGVGMYTRGYMYKCLMFM